MEINRIVKGFVEQYWGLSFTSSVLGKASRRDYTGYIGVHVYLRKVSENQNIGHFNVYWACHFFLNFCPVKPWIAVLTHAVYRKCSFNLIERSSPHCQKKTNFIFPVDMLISKPWWSFHLWVLNVNQRRHEVLLCVFVIMKWLLKLKCSLFFLCHNQNLFALILNWGNIRLQHYIWLRDIGPYPLGICCSTKSTTEALKVLPIVHCALSPLFSLSSFCPLLASILQSDF